MDGLQDASKITNRILLFPFEQQTHTTDQKDKCMSICLYVYSVHILLSQENITDVQFKLKSYVLWQIYTKTVFLE